MRLTLLPLIFFLSSLPAAAMPGKKVFTPLEIFSAFQSAYPEIISNIETKNGDVTITLRGKRFYWAEGRLLPEGEQHLWANYDPYPFYHYPKKIDPFPAFSEEEKKELLTRTAERDIRPVRRHPGFYNTLWRVYDRDTSWERVKTIYFLGLKTEVHRELLEDFAAIEEEIQKQAKNDSLLAAYINQLGQLEGYNWRKIAGTSSLSFHSYGAALDVIPYSYGGKQVYWRWARPFYPEWFSIPA